MQKKILNYCKSAFGIVISAFLVIWLLKKLDWQLVWSELVQANYLVIIPVFLITTLHFAVRAIRWRYLLPNGRNINFKNLFDAIMIGNLATFILPLRAGEFIRPLCLSRDLKDELSFAVTFASIVIERLFDLICVLITFAIILPFLPDLPSWVADGAIILSLIALTILALLIWAIFSPSSMTRICTTLTHPLPSSITQSINLTLSEILKGAAVLKITSNLINTIYLSLLMWVLNYGAMIVALYMFNVNQSILLGLTASVVLALAVAAPSAPGFIGIFQVATVASFHLFGESKEVATSYAIILHVLQYIMYIGFGGLALYKRGLKLTNFSNN